MMFARAKTEEEELDILADFTYEALKAALEKTAREGDSKHGIHFKDNELLCKTKKQREGIADFLEDLGFQNVTTGYYDPKEDERNGEVDEYTGWHYVDWF